MQQDRKVIHPRDVDRLHATVSGEGANIIRAKPLRMPRDINSQTGVLERRPDPAGNFGKQESKYNVSEALPRPSASPDSSYFVFGAKSEPGISLKFPHHTRRPCRSSGLLDKGPLPDVGVQPLY